MKVNRRRLVASVLAAIPPAAAGQNAPNAQSTDFLRLQSMISGYRISQLLYVAAKLRIADLLLSGPLPVKGIARRVKAHKDSMHGSSGPWPAREFFRKNPADASPRIRWRACSFPNRVRSALPPKSPASPGTGDPLATSSTPSELRRLRSTTSTANTTWEWFGENPEAAALLTRTWAK